MEYEYYFTGNGLPTFSYSYEKESKVPLKRSITWYDSKGVKVEGAFRGLITSLTFSPVKILAVRQSIGGLLAKPIGTIQASIDQPA